MARSWCDLSRECSHEVAKLRRAFLKEHERADQIVVNENGVPFQAIYFTPEMPGFADVAAISNITDKGLVFLGKPRLKPYFGYGEIK